MNLISGKCGTLCAQLITQPVEELVRLSANVIIGGQLARQKVTSFSRISSDCISLVMRQSATRGWSKGFRMNQAWETISHIPLHVVV